MRSPPSRASRRPTERSIGRCARARRQIMRAPTRRMSCNGRGALHGGRSCDQRVRAVSARARVLWVCRGCCKRRVRASPYCRIYCSKRDRGQGHARVNLNVRVACMRPDVRVRETTGRDVRSVSLRQRQSSRSQEIRYAIRLQRELPGCRSTKTPHIFDTFLIWGTAQRVLENPKHSLRFSFFIGSTVPFTCVLSTLACSAFTPFS